MVLIKGNKWAFGESFESKKQTMTHQTTLEERDTGMSNTFLQIVSSHLGTHLENGQCYILSVDESASFNPFETI